MDPNSIKRVDQAPETDKMLSQGSSALIAGVLAGVAGLLVFLVIHHLWIQPIWFILPFGLVIATIGGLAVGWSYAEVQVSLPPRPWTILALIALIGVILLPALVLAELRNPLFNVTGTSAVLSVGVGRAVAVFVLELLVTATLVGALAGWLIGRTGRAALATAVAGSVFALGPGHNIPLLGHTSAMAKGIVLLVAIIAVSAVVLVEAHFALSRGRRPGS